MIEALATPAKRIRTLVFLGVCAACAIGAAVVGISDNPPGILLAYLAATALVLALVHPWRTSRPFKRLLYGSVLGFVVSAVLHNLISGIASGSAGTGPLARLFEGLAGFFFIVAVLLCPPALLIGAAGAVIAFFRDRRENGSDGRPPAGGARGSGE